MKALKPIAAALLFSIGAAGAHAQTAPVTPPAEVPSTPATAPVTAPTPETTPAPAEPTSIAPLEQPGKIIFFRPGRLTGAVYTYHVVTVAEDGNSDSESPRVCSLPNGRYCVYEVAPGVYNFNLRGAMAVNLDQDRIRLEIESGQTYYIEQTVRIGLITGGFRLVPSTKEEFERRKPREWKLEEK
jgi:hypothetical protein